MKSLLIFRLRLEHLSAIPIVGIQKHPRGQTTCHIEVFAGDDAVPFFSESGWRKKPTMLVSAGAILRIERKYPNPAAGEGNA